MTGRFDARMTPRVRFIVWTLAVVALLGGQLAWIFLLRTSRDIYDRAILFGGHVALTIPAILIAALLATTPSDAIKLRRPTSEVIIIVGVAVLQLAAVVSLGTTFLPYPAGVLAATVVLLVILRSAHVSPWWAVVIAWSSFATIGGTW